MSNVIKIVAGPTYTVKITVGAAGAAPGGDYVTNAAFNAAQLALQQADAAEAATRALQDNNLSNAITSLQNTDGALQNLYIQLVDSLEDEQTTRALEDQNLAEVIAQKTLESTRAINNIIQGDINANGNTIINLKDAVAPSDPVTKSQLDAQLSSVVRRRGGINCSGNPLLPASQPGDRWEVTAAGKIGGASGRDVDQYNEIVCTVASSGGTWAAEGSKFYLVQGDVEYATESASGYLRLATNAETQAGTENSKAITALKLANWWTYVKTLAQTFAEKITFTSAPRFSSVNASQILKVDANKDLIGETEKSAFNKDFGTGTGTIPEIGSTLGNSIPVRTNGSGKLITEEWNVVRRQENQMQTPSGSTVQTDITNLKHTISPGTVWQFEAVVFANTNANASGARFSINIPSGATIRWGVLGNNNSKNAFASDTGTSINTAQTPTVFAVASTNGLHARIFGTVVNGANEGDVQIKIGAQNVSAQITIEPGSYIEFTRSS